MSTILVTDLLKDSKMPFEREREKISFTTFDVWHISCAPTYKEDHILFRMADTAFTTEEDERVAHALSEYERSWQDKVLSVQLERLNSLEWKYLSKGAGLAKTVK